MARPNIPSLPDWRQNRVAREQVRNFSYVLRAVALGRLPGEQTLSRGAAISRLLAALVLASILWVYITTQENPVQNQTFPNLPVTVQHVPKGLAVRSGLLTVTVTAHGLQTDVNRGQTLSPIVDLAGVPVSAREATIGVKLLGKNPSLDYTTTPPQLSLRLEPVKVRQVPVIFTQLSGLPTGLDEPTSPQVSPLLVTISGPQDQVDQVSNATVSAPVNTIAPPNPEIATFSVTLTLIPQLVDKQGRPLNFPNLLPASTKVKVTLQLIQLIQIRTLTIAPIISVGPPPGYILNQWQPHPLTVAVFGPPDALSTLRAIATDPINLQNVTHSMTITTHLDAQGLPPGVFIYSPNQQSGSGLQSKGQGPAWNVYVSLSPAPADEQRPARVTVANLGRNLHAQPDTHWIFVYIKGPYTILSKLGPLHATLNLKGLGPGIHALRPTIDLPAGLLSFTISPAVVHVTIGANSTGSSTNKL